MDLYRKNIFEGGWYSFNATAEDWVDHYADKMWDIFLDLFY